MNAWTLARHLSLGTLLLAMSLPALARIDPTKRCTMTLSPASIDYGQVVQRAGAAQTRQGGIALPVRTLLLNLVCPQAINLTLFYHAPSLDPDRFDLGGGGFYVLRVRDVRVDTFPVEIGLVTVPGEAPSRIADTLTWTPEHAWVPMRAGMQVPGNALSALIDVETVITRDLGSIREAQIWEAGGNLDAEDAREFLRLDLRAEATPHACMPRLTPSELDLGGVSRATLQPDAGTPLATRSVELQLTCSGPTRLALKLLDNRAGAAAAGLAWAAGVADEERFALPAREGPAVGVYALSLGPASAGGQTMQLVRGSGESPRDWRVQEEGTRLQRFDAQSSVYGFARIGHAAPAPVTEITTSLNVDVQLAPSSSLDATSEILLDGALTVEIVYL